MEPLGQYPDPTHVVAHLSDPHLLADCSEPAPHGTLLAVHHLRFDMVARKDSPLNLPE